MRKWTLAAFLGLVTLSTAPAFGVVTIEIGNVDPSGTTATVNVTLRSGGATVGGMQNDILFDTTKVNLASATACKINPEIGTNQPGCEEDPISGPCKTLSRNLASCGTSPTPPGCDGQPANVSRFRGIVAATAVPNNNEIPDGTVLYSCDFAVVDAGALPATLTNSNVVASNPTGTRLDATGTNGSIGGAVVTPTEGPEPTPTSGPSCTAAVCVNVGSGTTEVAGTVSIEVTATGDNIGGTQNDILFDTTKVTLANATACKINSAIGTNEPGCEEDPVVGPCKTLSRNLASCGTSPTPPGCEGQPATVSRFRGIVAATAVPNNNVIPSGTVLYTCDFQVADPSVLPAALTNSNIVASNPTGTRLDAGGDSGVISGGGVVPTATPTDQVPPTNTPVPPTNTPVPTATNTTVVVPATPTATTGVAHTPTRTATAVPTGPVFGNDDDGCQISTKGSTSNAWMLLIPTLGLLILRRNRK